jgi:uncharacterized protein YfaQ (DUF2300 family)
MFTSKKKMLAGVVMAFLIFCILGFQASVPAEWQKPFQPSLAGGALTCLAPHPIDPTKFLIASGHDIFEGDRSNAWQPLWSHAEANASIKNFFLLACSPTGFSQSQTIVFLWEA